MMQTKRTILITGASGLVGSGLVEKYLNKTMATLCLLVHTKPPALKTSSRVRLFNGDITKPRLGLHSEEYEFLVANVTEIMHCAAETKFSSTLEHARKVNLIGTQNILKLAEASVFIQKVGIVSTVYVAGKMVGTIKEGKISNTVGFVNAYEQSKYEMEQAVYKKMQTLPLSIYRLSTIIGDSETGEVKQYTGIHKAIRLFYNGLIPMVPGREDCRIDLISSNYATDALFDLFEEAFISGNIYNISAGEDALSLKEFLEITPRLFASADPAWGEHAFETPPVVSLKTFTLLKETVKTSNDHFLEQIIRSIDYFVPQLSYPKLFEPVKISGVTAENIRDYFPRIIHSCVRDWKLKKYRD